MSKHTVLIIGGNGKTGGRVNARLQSRGIATRPVSRSTAIPFDWNRQDTWAGALKGVSKAYVTYQPDITVEGAAEAIAELGHLANAKGLQQVVLLSGRGEPSAQLAEAALQASGVNCTIVRASWFNQNFSEGYLIDGVLAGESCCRRAPCPSRSSMPMTSPTWRLPLSSTNVMSTSSTSSLARARLRSPRLPERLRPRPSARSATRRFRRRTSHSACGGLRSPRKSSVY